MMKTRPSQLLACAAAAALVSACSSAPVSQSQSKSDAAREYAVEKESLESSTVIAPGFLLRITHGADESISGEYKVSFKGELKLPYKVKAVAAGKKPEQLAQ